jgi:hypothetical protein
VLGRDGIAWSPGQSVDCGDAAAEGGALQSGVTPSVAVGGVTVPQFPEAGLTADQSKRPPPSVGLTPQFDDSRAQNAAAALLTQGGP